MDACILLDTNPCFVAINWPFFTISPFSTIGTASDPMCCLRGITTFAGIGATSIGISLERSLLSLG